jgi:hypothetical protein
LQINYKKGSFQQADDNHHVTYQDGH